MQPSFVRNVQQRPCQSAFGMAAMQQTLACSKVSLPEVTSMQQCSRRQHAAAVAWSNMHNTSVQHLGVLCCRWSNTAVCKMHRRPDMKMSRAELLASNSTAWASMQQASSSATDQLAADDNAADSPALGNSKSVPITARIRTREHAPRSYEEASIKMPASDAGVNPSLRIPRILHYVYMPTEAALEEHFTANITDDRITRIRREWSESCQLHYREWEIRWVDMSCCVPVVACDAICGAMLSHSVLHQRVLDLRGSDKLPYIFMLTSAAMECMHVRHQR